MKILNFLKLNINIINKIAMATLLGMVFFLPLATFAEGGRNIHYNTGTNFRDLNPNIVYQPIVPTTINYNSTPTIYSGTSATAPKTSTTIVKKSPTTTNKVAKANTDSKTNSNVVKTSEDLKALAANATFGTNSFMPSGFLQWILFAILLLIIVILVRRIAKSDEHYQNTPLKHS